MNKLLLLVGMAFIMTLTACAYNSGNDEGAESSEHEQSAPRPRSRAY